MSIVLMLMLVFLVLSVLLGILGWGLSWISGEDRESSSPFECGFDPKSVVRLSFSVSFFLVAVVFLIFDVEIVLLLPMPMVFDDYGGSVFLGVLIYFLLILLGGLFFEWHEGALMWSA